MTENSYGYGGFNSRRKRNWSSSSSFGIDWNREPRIEFHEGENKDDTVTINEKAEIVAPSPNPAQEKSTFSQARSTIVQIGGREIQVTLQPKKERFEETHIRFTSYLEKDLHQLIQELRREGLISSVTELINEAIKAYFKRES
jgi:hypothetical protein